MGPEGRGVTICPDTEITHPFPQKSLLKHPDGGFSALPESGIILFPVYEKQCPAWQAWD
jgi:hypothetical protein